MWEKRCACVREKRCIGKRGDVNTEKDDVCVYMLRREDTVHREYCFTYIHFPSLSLSFLIPHHSLTLASPDKPPHPHLTLSIPYPHLPSAVSSQGNKYNFPSILVDLYPFTYHDTLHDTFHPHQDIFHPHQDTLHPIQLTTPSLPLPSHDTCLHPLTHSRHQFYPPVHHIISSFLMGHFIQFH